MDGSVTKVESCDPTRSIATDRPPMLLPRGAAVGRFVVLEALGGGATGTVYAAFDPTLDRQVALKILHRPANADEQGAAMQRGRVEREARAMARIRHPNVVTIYEVGVAADESVFLAMEKMEGGTLGAWLRTKRSLGEILRVFCEAGEGLAAAHRSGLVHRDFKLDNVLMDAHGHPRVTDFGLARAVGGSSGPVTERGLDGELIAHSAASLSEPLTRSGAVLGTPGYMPPEQYGAEPIDERADIFAFCASLYRGLYGVRPFVGETVDEIALSTLTGRLRDAPKDSEVPPWLRRVLLRGLATARDARPSSMDELLAMLRDDPARRWRRAIALAAGAALVLGGGWTFHAVGERRARACEISAERLGGVWDPARKAEVAAALRAAGTSYAEAAWTQVERVLDGYAKRWTVASEAACVATRVRGEQSEQMLELRAGCLEDRLAELRALTDVLASADVEVVKTSVKAARALSSIDACADVDRLSAAARLPGDPRARAEIRALEDEIAKAKELHEAGRKRQSFELLQSIRARVEGTDWGPILVHWHARVATAERRSDEKAAVADLEKAITLAERFRLDDRKAAAEIALGSLEGSWLGRTEDAHMWMRMADASIARLGGNAALEAERDEEEGWVYQYEHKPREAAPLFARVLVRAREAGIDDPDTIASAHSGLSDALAADGKWDEGEEHAIVALKTMEDAYGREHPWISGYLNNLAVAQLAAGHTDAALVSATRARDGLEAEVKRGDIDPNAPDYGLALHTLGEVQLRAGNASGAAASLGRARAVYIAAHGADNADVAYADNELAAAYRALNRRAEAQATLDEAARIEKNVPDAPAAIPAGTLAMQAELDLDRDDAPGALDHAERALALVQPGELTDWDAAQLRLVLAKALRKRSLDPERAEKLASEARDVFARLQDDRHKEEAAVLARGSD